MTGYAEHFSYVCARSSVIYSVKAIKDTVCRHARYGMSILKQKEKRVK